MSLIKASQEFRTILDFSHNKITKHKVRKALRTVEVHELVCNENTKSYTFVENDINVVIEKPIALNKNLLLEFHYENFSVNGNNLLLQQLLGNLIANAIQYTTEGNVFISLTSVNGLLNMKVSDKVLLNLQNLLIDQILIRNYLINPQEFLV